MSELNFEPQFLIYNTDLIIEHNLRGFCDEYSSLSVKI